MRLQSGQAWLAVLSILLTTGIIGFAWVGPAAVPWLSGERGVIEGATALFYATAALLAGLAAFHTSGWIRTHCLIWVCLSILFFGEETSWLQHQIGYETPAPLKAINLQGEFNIHNIAGLQGRKLTGDQDAASDVGSLIGLQKLFELFFAGYFLLLPLVAGVPPVHRLLRRFYVPYISLGHAAAIWLPIVTALALGIFASGDAEKAMVETREMLYAATILVFAALLARKSQA